MACPFAVVAFEAVSLEGSLSGLVSLVAAHVADHLLAVVVSYLVCLSLIHI